MYGPAFVNSRARPMTAGTRNKYLGKNVYSGEQLNSQVIIQSSNMNVSGSTKEMSAAILNSIDAKRNLSGVQNVNSSFDPYGAGSKKGHKSSKSSSKGINTSTNALLNSRRRLNK